jgi:hypothetical protein
VDNCKVVHAAKVKTDLAGKGQAFLEMWCQVSGGRYFSKGMNSAVSGRQDWKEIETPFMLQAGQKPEKITLNLVINGMSTVWIDDIVLSQAEVRGMDVSAYVADLLERAADSAPKKLSPESLRRTLDEIAQFSHKIPLLPDEALSRESLYQDHD